MNLAFLVVTCDSCGETWMASTEPCACEPLAVAPDPNVEVRRQLVFSTELTPPVNFSTPTLGQPEDAVWGQLQALMDRLMLALVAIAEERSEGSAMLGAGLSELRDEARRIDASCILRPWVITWKTIRKTLSDVEFAVSEYLHALTTAFPALAKEHGDRAQCHLNEISSRLDELDRTQGLFLTAADDPSTDPLDVLPGLARAAADVAGSLTIGEYDRAGTIIYRSITGEQGPCPPGLGVGLLTADFLGRVLYDQERLWNKAGEVFEILSKRPSDLRQFMSDPQFSAQFRQAMSELRDVVTETAAVSLATAEPRFEIRSMVRLAGRLVEPLAQVLLMPVVAARTRRPIGSWIRKDPEAVLQAAENVRDGLITEGFSIQLRNAEAHTSYRVQEWGVRILRTDGGTTDISTEELVDSVLTGVETLQGIYFGTVCALSNAGIDLEELPDADVWKLTTDQRIRLVLATFQWNDVTISRVADRLVVEGTGEFPRRPLSLAGACLASLKTEATIFELRGSQGQLEGPIEPMVAHEHAIDGLQREAAFVKCARLWTFDGEPVLSHEHVRKWVAMQAGRALGHTYAGRDLKVLRRLAIEVGDTDLGDSLGAAIRLRRARDLGLSPDPRDIVGLSILTEWEKRIVEPV